MDGFVFASVRGESGGFDTLPGVCLLLADRGPLVVETVKIHSWVVHVPHMHSATGATSVVGVVAGQRGGRGGSASLDVASSPRNGKNKLSARYPCSVPTL